MTAELTGIILNVAVLGFIGWIGLEVVKLRRENTEMFSDVRREMATGDRKLGSIDQAFRGYDGQGGLLEDMRRIHRFNHDQASFYVVACDQINMLNRFAAQAAPPLGLTFLHPGAIPLPHHQPTDSR